MTTIEKIKTFSLFLFFWSGSLIGFLGSAAFILGGRWVDGISFFLTFLGASAMLFYQFLTEVECQYRSGYLTGVCDTKKHERIND